MIVIVIKSPVGVGKVCSTAETRLAERAADSLESISNVNKQIPLSEQKRGTIENQLSSAEKATVDSGDFFSLWQCTHLRLLRT